MSGITLAEYFMAEEEEALPASFTVGLAPSATDRADHHITLSQALHPNTDRKDKERRLKGEAYRLAVLLSQTADPAFIKELIAKLEALS